jgi:uncharacterized protein (TIGR03000 family)
MLLASGELAHPTQAMAHEEASMFRQLLIPCLTALGGALLFGLPAQAQPPSQSSRAETHDARGPVMYGPLTYYGAQPAYGYPVRRAGEIDYGFVSHYTVADSPVFYTSINYPGVYGAYTIGVAARNYASRSRPSFYPPAAGFVLRDPIPLGPSLTTVEPLAPVRVATLTVRMPTANAELYIQGTRMTGTGTVRDFVTPALATNRDYTYDIRAVWRDQAGREVSRERHLTVRANDKLDIDLAAPEEQPREKMDSPTLRTIPRPKLPQR